MDKVKWKIYYRYEKEEKWLNDMAAKGLTLASYTCVRYVFTPCEPGEYIYRIELLPELPTHPQSREYIDFMRETGAELVATYFRWVYFRRKASEGAFNIYSDIDSRIAHDKRLFGLCSQYVLKIRRLKKEKQLRE